MTTARAYFLMFVDTLNGFSPFERLDLHKVGALMFLTVCRFTLGRHAAILNGAMAANNFKVQVVLVAASAVTTSTSPPRGCKRTDEKAIPPVLVTAMGALNTHGRAAYGLRSRDLDFGKVALYQLS